MIPMALVFSAGYLALRNVPTAETSPLIALPQPTRSLKERLTESPTYAFRSLACFGAIGIVLLGAAPMASASLDPNADPIVARAIDGTPSAENIVAPAFRLLDQRGRTVSLSALRGKTVALTFLDPVCTSDCPLIAQEFRAADGLLGAEAHSVELVAIDANPLYRAQSYTIAFDDQEGLERLSNWLYLTGSVAELNRGLGCLRLAGGVRARRFDDRPWRHRVRHRPKRAHSLRPRRRPGARDRSYQVLLRGHAGERAAQRAAIRMSRGTRVLSVRLAAALSGAALGALLLAPSIPAQVAVGQHAARSEAPVSTPLATSLEEGSGSWATIAMGHLDQPLNTFWQLFYRPSVRSRWSDVVEGTAVATNGGLVLAAPEGRPLLVGVLPSQQLHFSPLLSTADGGRTFTPALALMTGLATRPDALSGSADGAEFALVGKGGGTKVLQTAPGLTSWRTLVSEAQLASSTGGRSCGLDSITSVADTTHQVLLGAECEERDAVGIFSEGNGTWQLVGPRLPRSLASGHVEVLGLRRSGNGLSALLAVAQGSGTSVVGAWTSDGLTQWTFSSPLRLASDEVVRSFGPGAGPGWFVLTANNSGSKALEVLGAAASWAPLPRPPEQAATASVGPGPVIDVLGVSGSSMTDWRLSSAHWAKAQVIDVPIPYGSSG